MPPASLYSQWLVCVVTCSFPKWSIESRFHYGTHGDEGCVYVINMNLCYGWNRVHVSSAIVLKSLFHSLVFICTWFIHLTVTPFTPLSFHPHQIPWLCLTSSNQAILHHLVLLNLPRTPPHQPLHLHTRPYSLTSLIHIIQLASRLTWPRHLTANKTACEAGTAAFLPL